jgi:hypothetical protein
MVWGIDSAKSQKIKSHFILPKKLNTFLAKKSCQKKYHFFCQKTNIFFVKKRTSFFCPKIDESHFFSILESPAYISANRVGNFFYIEKRQFFQNYLIKFPTHFPERYVEWRTYQGARLLHHFCGQKVFEKVFNFCSLFL